MQNLSTTSSSTGTSLVIVIVTGRVPIQYTVPFCWELAGCCARFLPGPKTAKLVNIIKRSHYFLPRHTTFAPTTLQLRTFTYQTLIHSLVNLQPSCYQRMNSFSGVFVIFGESRKSSNGQKS